MAESAQEKGDRLERAVRAIEETILRSSPNYSDRTFRFASKKIVLVGGVHHEIDVHVEVDLGPGYQAVFTFECKNWEQNVGKNEIIVFQEKIDAAQAQRGFFVARGYTKDAIAQAAKEPRIELLYVDQLPVDGVPVPFDFHAINIELTHIAPTGAAAVTKGVGGRVDFDLRQARVEVSGQPVEAVSYLKAWGYEAAGERTKTFPSGDLSGDLAVGKYELDTASTREFAAGEFRIDDYELTSMTIAVRFTVEVFRPGILSHLSVGGRGRVVELEPIPLFGGQIRTAFTALEPGQPEGGTA
jgi:hypothetical protein